MQLKTLSPENQAIITCPIFRSDTKIAACFQLRELVWRGDRPAVRLGCQVAMDADKCPIPRMIKEMMHKPGDDPYHAPEPRKVAIRQSVLDSSSPVLISEKAIEACGASANEKAAMRRCNNDARNGSRMTSRTYAPPKPPSKTKVEVDDKITTAAATGDMSAAINTESAL